MMSSKAVVGRVLTGARTVVSSPGCGTPETLLTVLADLATGAHVFSGLTLGADRFFDAVAENVVRYSTWHVMGRTRALIRDSGVDYIPLRSSGVATLLRELRPDVAMVRVSIPDRHGYCSLGPSVSYTRDAMELACTVVAEVDPSYPRTCGDSIVHVSTLDFMIESETPTCEYVSAPISPVAEAIARHIVGLIPEHPVLQLGIGAIPEALTSALVGSGLGPFRFVGMGTDRMLDLFESGDLLSSDIVPVPAVFAAELMGTRQLFEFSDVNPAIGVYPSSASHNAGLLGQLDRFVSVNSAIEVDLTGQVCSEVMGGETVAGVGGSVDYFESAYRSSGGRGIIALPASAMGGTVSRIVPRLSDGAAVTIPRHAVDAVVTEHGAAVLAGRSLRERAEALIAISDPGLRDELTERSFDT